MMRYGSVCSGIEAATVAWHPLGWTPAFFAEIDKFPSAVLAHHYGSNIPGEPHAANGVPNYGDMTTFEEWPDERLDVLVGGTPCQSFSIAGLRKGLDDPRGNLMLTYLAIAKRYRSDWLVWENVPGVLSSNEGRDFGTFIRGMEECGYHAAWRVLDAQYVRVDGFGRAIPQRRRRVFVVGYLGDWRRAAAVLFEPEGMSRHPAPRRKTGQGTAATISARPTGGGEVGADEVARCDTAGYAQRLDWETENFVAHSLKGEGFDASEDGTGRGTPLVPVMADLAQITSKTNRSSVSDVSSTLSVNSDGIVAFSSKDYGADAENDLPPTLRAGGHDGSHANAGVPPAIAIQERAVSKNPSAGPGGVGVWDDGAAFTLEARQTPQAVAHGWAVRRLTPTECHRLQGFPDGYCNIPWRGKDHAPDGPQYKALGNSMAVNVMRWIGRRIEMVASQ